ncbi:DUF192 domain-containing protein [Candidatus Woesearchaeota archaeon]|nr:DUF192 domain-containing protein [Candidatus Woesearchaeota archaeon]
MNSKKVTLVNKTNQKTIANNVIICTSPFQQMRGLMFRKKPIPLLFPFKKEKYCSIHMGFVFFPIDLLFLDEHKRIVEMKQKIRPFRCYTTKRKIKYMIELPANTITSSACKIGSSISFK